MANCVSLGGFIVQRIKKLKVLQPRNKERYEH